MLSDRIEKTGTKEKGFKNVVYPKHSLWSKYNVQYSDKSIAATDILFNNNQSGVSIWLGFQRGKKSKSWFSNHGTEGIPIERKERIKTAILNTIRIRRLLLFLIVMINKPLKTLARNLAYLLFDMMRLKRSAA